jgi:hypothetical protein
MAIALKAHVRSRRLVLDEPTTLPEGAEVLLLVDPADDLDEEERAEPAAVDQEPNEATYASFRRRQRASATAVISACS